MYTVSAIWSGRTAIFAWIRKLRGVPIERGAWNSDPEFSNQRKGDSCSCVFGIFAQYTTYHTHMRAWGCQAWHWTSSQQPRKWYKNRLFCRRRTVDDLDDMIKQISWLQSSTSLRPSSSSPSSVSFLWFSMPNAMICSSQVKLKYLVR